MEAGEAKGPYKGTQWPMSGRFTPLNRIQNFLILRRHGPGQKEATTMIQTTDISLMEGKQHYHKSGRAIYKSGPDADMAIQGMEAVLLSNWKS